MYVMRVHIQERKKWRLIRTHSHGKRGVNSGPDLSTKAILCRLEERTEKKHPIQRD